MDEAYELISEVIVLRKGISDETHPEMLESKAVLAECFRKLKLKEEAERMLQEVAFQREAVLGAIHNDTLNSKE